MKLKEYFPGLLNYKMEEGSSPKTIQEYTRIIHTILDPAIGDIDLEDIREIDVGKIKVIGRQHGRYGEQRGVVTFRQLLQYIKKTGLKIPFDWRDLTLPKCPDKEVDALSKDEWETVRNAFDLNWIIGLRDRALVELLWATGMRISEALALNRDSVPWETKELSIRNAKPPHQTEKIYFTDESLYWLRQYLQVRNETFDPLFVNLTGQRATPGGVRRTIQTTVKKAGIEKRIHPHLFRSTFVTNLLQGTQDGAPNTDIKTVQVLARHRSERTTLKHYTAVMKGRAKKEHERVLNQPLPKVEIDFVKELMFKRN